MFAPGEFFWVEELREKREGRRWRGEFKGRSPTDVKYLTALSPRCLTESIYYWSQIEVVSQ